MYNTKHSLYNTVIISNDNTIMQKYILEYKKIQSMIQCIYIVQKYNTKTKYTI